MRGHSIRPTPVVGTCQPDFFRGFAVTQVL